MVLPNKIPGLNYRAPPLGLSKSIYYFVGVKKKKKHLIICISIPIEVNFTRIANSILVYIRLVGVREIFAVILKMRVNKISVKIIS